MSHHNNGGNFLLILILCLLFPEAAMAFGFVVILMYIWPIVIIAGIIFILYALVRKQTKKTIVKKPNNELSKEPVLLVTDNESSRLASQIRSSPNEFEYGGRAVRNK